MQIEKIKEILSQFSFSDQEIEIYLAVLTMGSSSVTEIAKKVGMSRTNAYFHIKSLKKKAVLLETRKGKTLYFVAKPASELSQTFSRTLDDFKGLVPLLDSLKTVEQETPKIEIQESAKGYLKVYEEISFLPEGSTFRCIEGKQGLIDEFKIFSGEHIVTFFSRVIERNIKTLGVFTNESLSIPKTNIDPPEAIELLQKRDFDLRSLPESIMPIQALALIYGNKVSFLFPETSMVMTIEHKGIVQFIEAMFDGLFHFAEKVTW